MATATPSVETVLAAIKAEIESIPSIGTVRSSDQTIDDDIEFLVDLGVYDEDSFDVWVAELRGVTEFEGDAAGEKYDIYSIGIRYWSLRTDDPDWSEAARTKAAAVAELLSGNEDVFRIDGQVQLRTPESVSIESHGRRTIDGDEGPQMIYQTILSLQVEARRWG